MKAKGFKDHEVGDIGNSYAKLGSEFAKEFGGGDDPECSPVPIPTRTVSGRRPSSVEQNQVLRVLRDLDATSTAGSEIKDDVNEPEPMTKIIAGQCSSPSS